MELYNDLKFSGKGLYDIINDDNSYTNQGIIFNSNQDFSIQPNSINFKYQPSFNNILHISSNSNIGIGIQNPKYPLEVAGSISCFDMNINNSILNKDVIYNIGFSANDIKNGILKINNGGIGSNSLNQEELLIGDIQQSPFLIWKDNERRLGIGISNPLENVDVDGDTNAIYYRKDGIDIREIFVKDLSISSNECFFNSSNANFINSLNYTNVVKDEIIKYIDSRTIDWIKYGKNINYIYSKVGIGTAEPSSSLYIIGDINYSGQLRRNGVLRKIFYGDYADLENNKGYAWGLSNGEVFNLNAGCVGIGSQIPRYNLDIDGGINFQSNMKRNGNIINFFDSDFNKLSNIPPISKFGYSGSFNNLTETPFIFINKYSNLNDIPFVFPANWNTSISNIPTFFPTDWNTQVFNKPDYFLTNWNSSIDNKPKLFDVDWNATIYGKPDFFPASWCNIINKPDKFNADWYSNILNVPAFEKVAFTGQYSNLLNRPKLFSGLYKDLREKPKYSRVAFTGNYYQLSNLPNLFTGEFSTLSNLPTNFQADWNTTLINKPDFSRVAYSGLYYDTIGFPIDNWGENGNNIYSCNSSNIGIGITNPEFKLDLKGGFNANNIFSVNYNKIIKDNQPWGIYFAEDWNGTTLPDVSGNNRNTTTSGTINLLKSNGNGATSEINYISGGTSSTILWPSGSIPSTFTIVSLTRYTGGSRGRILQSRSGMNWLHGHWNGNRGVCYYEGWKTSSSSTETLDDWLICIGRNTSITPNNIIVNGVARGDYEGGNGNGRLCLNGSDYGEASDWAFGCVLIWDKKLTDEECFKLNDIIKSYLDNGGSLKKIMTTNLEINGISYINNNTNLTFVSSGEYYRTSNWNKVNSSNIYNYNSGSIGINTNIPSSSYKLDVKGLINANNLLLNEGLNWSSCNAEIRMPKTNNSLYSPSSLINDLIIRSQVNKKIIIANGTNDILFLNLGNIGIGTTSPQSTIHIHNSSSNQDVKLNLSTSFYISKNSNNEGIIWNSNKGINFGTNYINRLSISSSEELTPWGIYHAGNYSNNTLYDLSGNNRHAITSGTITSGNSNGNGATSNIKFISGDTSATISWPLGSIPNNFTILTLTRYNGATRRRIIMAQSGNWLHGHYDGNRGVCHYDGWKTPNSSTGTQDNWLCCIGRNLTTTPNNIIVDGIGRGNATGGTSNLRLSVNIGNGETSDWSLSYVVIWNRHLTDDEVFSNNSLITTYLTNGTEPTFISSSISGGKTDINISSSLTSYNIHNSSSNQEVKINLTDASTTSGFSIYKSSNHDGFLWNSNNNFIAFGTNNLERMRINNGGFIGLGTNNPQSTIHIHNSSSNQEVKINLSTNFNIFKNSNNEGIIWNSNKGINFGTNYINRLSISSSEELTPWGIYHAGNYSNNTLYDLSGNNRHAITSGTITSGNSNGNGATSNIKFISGDTSATINWPLGSIPNNFTILTLTRYNGATRRRIIMAQSGNWLHGHHNGNRGVCHYDGWKTPSSSTGTQDNWLCCIGRNLTTTPNNIIVDGIGRGNATGGTSNLRLSVNIGNGETSDWSLSYVVIWNRHLTDDEVMSNNSLITTYLTNGTEPIFISSSISGGKTDVNISSSLTSLNLYNYSLNQEVKIDFSGFSIYKSNNHDGFLWNSNNNFIAFGTNNLERMRLNNLGNIGIGTNNPQSTIHIHNSSSNQEIKINLSTSFFLSKNSNNEGIIWNSSNNFIAFGTNNLERMRLINGRFLGIGTTNPQSTIHIHNSSSNQEVKIDFSGFSIYKSNNHEGFLWNSNNNFIAFGTNNIERLIISNTGKIGIGTNNTTSDILRINGTIRGNLRGNGNSITNLNFVNFTTGSLNISNGGLGISNPIINQVLIGNSSNSIIQSANLIWSNNRLGVGISNPSNELDVNGIIKGNMYGNGSSLTNLQISNITNGILNVNNGGTGVSTLTINQILIGNGSNAIIQTSNLFWSNNRLGILNTNPSYNLDISGTINGSFRGNGSLTSNLDAGNFSLGTLNISNGGLGVSSFNSNQILIGNTTTNNLFWHITSNFLGINNSSPSNLLDINGTLNASNIEGNGSNLTNVSIFSSTLLNINKGGTGIIKINENKLLTGNGISSTIIETTNLIWNGTDKLVINSNLFDSSITNNLTIFGDINFTGNIRQNGNIYIGTGIKGEWTRIYTGFTEILYNGFTPYDNPIYVLCYNSGTVGIGTTTPDTTFLLDLNDKKINLNYNYFYQGLIIGETNPNSVRVGCELGPHAIFFTNNEVEIWFNSYDYIKGIKIGSNNYIMRFEVFDRYNTESNNNGYYFDGKVSINTVINFNQLLNVGHTGLITTSNILNCYYINIASGLGSNTLSFNGTICAIFYNNIFIKSSNSSSGVIIISDIRIKNNINDINSKYALEIISKINPKTFKYIDYFEYGTKNNYGFIAQDIKKLIPEAIEFRKEFIPNIMKTFNINKDIIETNEDLTSKLNINDIIQIIDIDNKKEKYKILEISSNHIKIDKNIEGNKCFIYGKEVNDFHNLSKDIIYTLNVSAIKELNNQIKKQKKILKTQEEILKTQEEILMEQERRFEEQEKQIKYLLNII